MEKNKVSIIVPVYKTEKYLEGCLQSIIGQTYSNIEIILVDDGSPDGCGSICDRYRASDSRIVVLHKENEGLGYARNSGLDIATGDYVAFVDSDDYLEPNMIFNLMEEMVANGADTCVGGFRRVRDNGEIVYTEHYEKVLYMDNQIKDTLMKRILGSIPKKHDSFKMSVWSVLYSMEIIKREQIRFHSEKVFISEDLIFNFDYYMAAHRVCIFNGITYNYRVNAESLTNTYKSDKLKRICALYEEMKERVLCTYRDDKNEALYRLQAQFLVNVRSCIHQECFNKFERSKKERLDAIYNICTNEDVKQVVSGYPAKLLDIRQCIFVIMVRFKMSRILEFCSCTLNLF